MRTNNKNPPKLHIENCKFKFFVNKHDALIQVETNNLGYFGEEREDEEGGYEDHRFLTYYGEDRGANIAIVDSEFYSNSFCKGLIYYRRFDSVFFDDYQQMLNFTANYQGVTDQEEDAAKTQNVIKIKDSVFQNTGFHQVVSAVNLDSNRHNYSEETFISDIEWKQFMDQGSVLNVNGFSGAV